MPLSIVRVDDDTGSNIEETSIELETKTTMIMMVTVIAASSAVKCGWKVLAASDRLPC
jgi:hypothetical protein